MTPDTFWSCEHRKKAKDTDRCVVPLVGIPAVVVHGWLNLVFNDSTGQDGFLIPSEDDLFAPLLGCFFPRAPSPPRARR